MDAIFQCASLSDGHAGLEMGSPRSPLLKPFRGLLARPREKPFATVEEKDSPVISLLEKCLVSQKEKDVQ